MEQTLHEFKYQKHSKKEYEAILSAAENLFNEKGIDNVGLADIAAAHRKARAPLLLPAHFFQPS